MSHKKKGHLTTSEDWAVHLRKERKRKYWKGERQAGKDDAEKQSSDQSSEGAQGRGERSA